MRQHIALSLIIASCGFSGAAHAHTSEQGFVLLLPTDVYIFSGVFTVLLTVAALIVLPAAFTCRLFTPLKLMPLTSVGFLVSPLRTLLGGTSLLLLTALLAVGFSGTHDPLKNILPLTIWTVFWIALVALHGLIGNFWPAINPWTLLTQQFSGKFHLPRNVGSWPGVLIFFLFTAFALADPAPEDPLRLAWVVSGYFTLTLLCCYLFGPQQWMRRGECFSMVMSRMALISPVGRFGNRAAIGCPGWKGTSGNTEPLSFSGAVFSLGILATGSFDGINETFWWLEKTGINPLEFPGRSAVVWETVAGMLLSVVALLTVYSACIFFGNTLGNRATDAKVSFYVAFTRLSVAIIPIALAYHIAHYLTAFMVNIQYTLAALTDPLQNGRDLLGLGTFYVTTGFFNSQSSVKTIWLTQATTVVIGHVVSLLMSHRIALSLWPRANAASLSQAPMAVFMVLYTLLGLWLLAAPRGA